MDDQPAPVAPDTADRASGAVVHRHALPTRLWHWINAVTLFVMIGSGIGILNAHPRLYWGQFGANPDPAWLDLGRVEPFLRSGWVTIPARYNLALSRRWHLLFALALAFGLLAYLIVSLVNRHIQRDLRLRGAELAPRHLLADLKAHLAFRFHDPEHPAAYNIFQKLSYILVLFVLLPAMILSGLTLSPGMDAAWPWLLDLMGGRASARSVHFIAASGLVLFVIVHLTLVILAGPWNEVRSMITGRWRVPEDEA